MSAEDIGEDQGLLIGRQVIAGARGEEERRELNRRAGDAGDRVRAGGGLGGLDGAADSLRLRGARVVVVLHPRHVPGRRAGGELGVHPQEVRRAVQRPAGFRNDQPCAGDHDAGTMKNLVRHPGPRPIRTVAAPTSPVSASLPPQAVPNRFEDAQTANDSTGTN